MLTDDTSLQSVKQRNLPPKTTFYVIGGEDEIRTHGTIAGTHAFQACAFNHSATSPLVISIPANIPLNTEQFTRAF